jgi:hypothetical protein
MAWSVAPILQLLGGGCPTGHIDRGTPPYALRSVRMAPRGKSVLGAAMLASLMVSPAVGQGYWHRQLAGATDGASSACPRDR